MMEFNDVLGECELIDMGMTGGRFTWEKGRGTDTWVEERLDRVVATVEWLEMHDGAVVKNIYTNSSDHCALLVDLHTKPDRIAICGERLSKWGGDYHRQFGARSKELRHILAKLKEDRTPHAVAIFLAAEREFAALMKAEEVFWKQRSKQLWLKHGDANTKYFHRSATARRKHNMLSRVKDQNGMWAEGTAMNSEIIRYFEHIFCSGPRTANLFDRVRERVTNEMKISLSQPFTMADVKSALFDMKPEMAPGPDGMSPAFFLHFWPVLGHDLTMFILHCVEHKQFPPELNDSNIVLIPKKPVPEKVSDLLPIAMCNVVYKVLAKMLANKLKGCLAQIVSQSQSAFVPECLPTDNIIVAGEIGHYLRRKTGGGGGGEAQGWAALKLDMAKAYDRMEWPFLEGMMRALGLERGWVEMIMLCVTSVNYSIMVNGDVAGRGRPTRGIRQGDPLLPYLFIICAEGLSILLQQAEARGDIHSVRVVRGAPTITHLFFADDSLLFFRANEREVLTVKECLEIYSMASGQLINFEKSSAIYSHNTTVPLREVVSRLIGVPEAVDLGHYLGLPSVLGRNKTIIFKYIEENIRARIGMWQNKIHSRVGQEVLIKSIAQSLPIFTMSVFLLPVCVCDSLEKMFNRYWWGGGSSGSRVIHWLSWGRMCTPKSKGGLGFKKLHEFNITLLAKQGWRLLIHPDSLVSRLLKAKYYPTTGFMDAQIGQNPSFIRRSILAGGRALQLGVARRIDDGRDTRIWGWDWLAGPSNIQIHTPCVEQLREAKVHSLLNEARGWDVDLLRDIFLAEYVPRILATPVSNHFRDSWRWKGDIRGCYTVQHGYRLLVGEVARHDDTHGFLAWKALWALPIPPKDEENVLWGRDAFNYMSQTASWSPPLRHTFKCNVDAALSGDGASFGAVVRDSEGRFVATKSGRLKDVDDPYMAEVLGVKEALLWLKSQFRRNIIVESDCLNFCNAFNSCNSDFSYVGLVVKQCLSIASDMENISVSRVKRSANRVAHELARATVSMAVSGVWTDIPPSCIVHYLS
ncbi:PREDICTED: uncharacterized protein LOC109184710 [Ipomoea nil]|uniref:uncharacterized protein LOC109184710 n=1 Tax=Ipomoea nil TaxID=35883 RepID=UPI0009013BB7|nr:PREDICTED: uncharacterized protein LOC109184710 [Ipomoea nil]